jgi:hypothetical protein
LKKKQHTHELQGDVDEDQKFSKYMLKPDLSEPWNPEKEKIYS